MSYNDDNPARSARRHIPALIAIALAILVAVAAFVFFAPESSNEDNLTPIPPSTEAPAAGNAATGGAQPESQTVPTE